MFMWNGDDELPLDTKDGDDDIPLGGRLDDDDDKIGDFEVWYKTKWIEQGYSDFTRACRVARRDEQKALKRLHAGETLQIGLGRWRLARPTEGL